MKFAPLLVALVFLPLSPLPSFGADLRVTLAGFEETTGGVRVALFASAEDFAADRPFAGQFRRLTTDTVELVFTGLAPGRYGIITFHDQNENEKLDSNLVGMPSEPLGFSKNARGRFGPPAFDDFAVQLGEDDISLEILLQ